MTVPTTGWGNLTDVYSTIPGPTSSSPGSSDGPVLGNYLILADFSVVQFLQFTANTAANKACQVDLANNNWQNAYQVTPTTAINQLVMAVNDLSLISLTANYCAWGKRYGLAFPLVAASVAHGAIVASSATSGTLYAAAAGTDLQGTITNTVAVGGGGGGAASSPCLMT